MREVFQQELAEVQDRLVEISELVLDSIRDASTAFNTSDVALADKVIAADPTIDELAVELDELSIEILYRQTPVARDLRIVVSALRMSASLERMGDLARHIAQLARRRYPNHVAPDALRDTFVQMAAEDVHMAELLTQLLRTQDVALGDQLIAQDASVDALHRSVFDNVLGAGWSGEAEQTVDVTLASRFFERFADHAASIAKKVQYLATGDWVPEDTR
ncbi:phosphate signaling complex protein PhoU [Gryllotalpicola ginsengisoli]|uniref:phosphate signaling complex protein PhoU n=1 Tax=Gryllotalpicola ginsengisoli TaxID=444608 RepID=UPI0003B6ADDA|nr:phosphate signaling complex protein PhoU [Gryllotalpicola ginsengisoli]